MEIFLVEYHLTVDKILILIQGILSSTLQSHNLEVKILLGHNSLVEFLTIKERLHSIKSNSNFEIAALFHHLQGKGKSAAILKLELFLTQWSRSYFVFSLRKFLI